MTSPLANVKTLKAWRRAVHQRGTDLLDELARCPSSNRHWNESLEAHVFNDCKRQVEIGLAAIDGLVCQAIERHLNGEAGH